MDPIWLAIFEGLSFVMFIHLFANIEEILQNDLGIRIIKIIKKLTEKTYQTILGQKKDKGQKQVAESNDGTQDGINKEQGYIPTRRKTSSELTVRKIKGALFAVLLSITLTSYVLATNEEKGLQYSVSKMGFNFKNEPRATVQTLISLVLLYLGPIYVDYLLMNHPWMLIRESLIMSWYEIESCKENIIGPVLEEIVYRASIIPLLLEAGFGKEAAMFISSILFGIAHLYHIIEKRKAKWPWSKIIPPTALQFTYTTIFSLFNAYIFTKTQSVYACILSHVFCNVMGLPDLGALKEIAAYKPTSVIAYTVGILGFILLMTLY